VETHLNVGVISSPFTVLCGICASKSVFLMPHIHSSFMWIVGHVLCRGLRIHDLSLGSNCLFNRNCANVVTKKSCWILRPFPTSFLRRFSLKRSILVCTEELEDANGTRHMTPSVLFHFSPKSTERPIRKSLSVLRCLDYRRRRECITACFCIDDLRTAACAEWKLIGLTQCSVN